MKNSTPRLALLAFLIIALVPAGVRAANSVAADAPAVLLIQNATILTVSHGTIEHGSILIKDGKIVDVGPGIKAANSVLDLVAAGDENHRGENVVTAQVIKNANVKVE